jgi:NAD(P)-dependent dehydrogenase (short-subunit alcohol dehydrogenase family)
VDTSDAWGQGVGYGTTKAALSRLTNGLARELKPYNIACIAVDPGATMTELMEMAVKSRGIKMSAHSLAVPAEAVVFLATHPNPMAFTGQVVNAAEIVGGVRFFQQIFG